MDTDLAMRPTTGEISPAWMRHERASNRGGGSAEIAAVSGALQRCGPEPDEEHSPKSRPSVGDLSGTTRRKMPEEKIGQVVTFDESVPAGPGCYDCAGPAMPSLPPCTGLS